jgi:hypothetical protein
MVRKGYSWLKKESKAGANVVGLIYPNFKKIIFMMPALVILSSSVASHSCTFCSPFSFLFHAKQHKAQRRKDLFSLRLNFFAVVGQIKNKVAQRTLRATKITTLCPLCSLCVLCAPSSNFKMTNYLFASLREKLFKHSS